jgi:hypothetical protein
MSDLVTQPPNVGFLTVISDGTNYLGGFLVTNFWGRPLEFRLTTAVQPNRVQQILYANTLAEYVCADLIGRTLIEKTGTASQLIVTDNLNVLPVRSRLEIPVVALQNPELTNVSDLGIATHPRVNHARSQAPLLIDPRYPDDVHSIPLLLDRLDSALELTEPFTRIRDAISEARKMGVTSRAA